jgi:hypothetical protein
MPMSRITLFFISFFVLIQSCFSQQNANSETRILFHGIVKDAGTFSPISNSQILINREFYSVSSNDGTFSFYVNRMDTVLFRHLGYKSAFLNVSDTLAGREFVAGIFMNSDTISIGEVIIVPRFSNLKSEIMNAPTKIPATMENARYNVALSAYQGRTTQGKLGDPATNYELLRQRQKVYAYEKGGIPSDKMIGISPLLLIPAAYLLIHGLPEKPVPFEQKPTSQELEQIQKKFMETLKQRK